MKQDLINRVRQRAEERCEYCHFPAEAAWLPFQLDHIIAEKHGGPTNMSNLALACYYCNSFKGSNIAGVDPHGQPDVAVQLFHPRKDEWTEHFRWNGPLLVGMTSTGRVTVAVLRINDAEAVEVRRLLFDAENQQH